MLSQCEFVTSHFYNWEKRGRGWDIHPNPIDLEPTFEPFVRRFQPSLDDGIRKSLFQRIGAFFRVTDENPEAAEAGTDKPLPFPQIGFGPLSVLRVSVPSTQRIGSEEMEQLLVLISTRDTTVSFELVATALEITLQFVCAEEVAPYLQNLIEGFFPSCSVRNIGSVLTDWIDNSLQSYSIDLGLAEEFMRPLKSAKNFDIDPFIPLFSVLETLTGSQRIFIQILFKATINPWADSILKSVSCANGTPFFVDAPEMLPLAEEKCASPLLAVVIRIFTQGVTNVEAETVNEKVVTVLCQMTDSGSNSLITLPMEGLNPSEYISDLVYRRSHRHGMLLNCSELANLVHFPTSIHWSKRLMRQNQKTKLTPAIASGDGLVIGYNSHEGQIRPVSLDTPTRLKHMHILGATGTGKSTLLLNCILQDIEAGRGVALLDPHGDLVESILGQLPIERAGDVLYIDPADAEFPVGFNILHAHSDIEKEILASDLVAVFKRLSTSWGDQMNSIFANAILAFLESSAGGTLVDLKRFLVEKSFRDSFLQTVHDASLIYYWQKEFPLLRANSVSPILTRLDAFLRPKLIRNMVSQRKSLDFANLLNDKKIILAKLSQGLIGAENSYLLGSFLVSKIQQTAMARQALSKEDRSEFYLYIDEFQNFITPSMTSILSGARKYGLGLVLAHQDLQQLTRADADVANSVLSNASTRICFRLGDSDAKKLEGGFSFFEASDLQNLETGEAICKVDRANYDFNLVIEPPLDFDAETSEAYSQYCISRSREKYASTVSLVEESNHPVKEREAVEAQGSPRSRPKDFEVTEPHLKVREKPSAPANAFKTNSSKNQAVTRSEVREHLYLQNLIKRMAESRGFKAGIEVPTPDGKGRVDVALERNGKRIAVEIKHSTKDEWELGNIEKCLAADYDLVIECTKDPKIVKRLTDKVEGHFTEEEASKIQVLQPEELFHLLDKQVAGEASTETRVKGYRVKVEYHTINNEEQASIKRTISKAMIGTKL